MREARGFQSVFVRAMALIMLVAVLAGCAAPMGSSQNTAPMSAPEMPMEAPAAQESAAQDSIAQSDGDAGVSGNSTSALLNRLLIANASMDLVVGDTAATLAAVETLLQEEGGYISDASLSSDSTGDPSQQYGRLTLRVPAENLDATLDALAALAIRVRNRTITREDITDQYTDNDARLRTLRATEEELLAMLEEVRERPNATPDDILAVHNRLMEIRGQIEQVQGQKNMYDNLVALSTIYLSIVPDSAAAPIVEEGWQPGSVLRNATRALVGALQGLGDFLIWFIVFALPLILIVLAPIVLFILFVRWLFRRGKKKDAVVSPETPSASS